VRTAGPRLRCSEVARHPKELLLSDRPAKLKMGNQPSSEKSSSSRSATSHDKAERDKRVNRRQSVQALQVSLTRGAPADPSATPASAIAQTSSRPFEPHDLQQYVQASPSPESGSRSSRVSRTASRRKRDELEHRPKQPPVAVPQSSTPMNVPVARSKQDSLDKKGLEKHWEDRPEPSPYDDRRYVPPAELRPQRMPLPIAGAPAFPESPTLDPVNKGTQDVPLFDDDVAIAPDESALRRKSSVMSLGTQDEEDVDEELPAADPGAGTVQTVIEWTRPGHRVYVTGTFANWEKKFRMHHKKDGNQGQFVTIALPPGTHHLMFLVDDVMMTNPDLPTAVDFNNMLVNYVEIATEDLVKPRRESNQTVTEKREVVYPAVVSEEDEEGVEQPLHDADQTIEEVKPGDFRQIVPRALSDIDLPDDDPRYQDAARVISDLSGPPTLPLFLGKAILNSQLPNKDDSSVLGLPNHTVLNHLMTSSVKNGVLATSVTTRYRDKYVTTISFKPVPKPSKS